MHDIPYVSTKKTSPEVVSTMTRICTSVKRLVPEQVPCGLQVGLVIFFFQRLLPRIGYL